MVHVDGLAVVRRIQKLTAERTDQPITVKNLGDVRDLAISNAKASRACQDLLLGAFPILRVRLVTLALLVAAPYKPLAFVAAERFRVLGPLQPLALIVEQPLALIAASP